MKIKLVANRKVRLDKYISDNSDLSREQINKIIDQKNCLVDGSPALKKSQMIDIDNTIIIDTKDNLEQNNDLNLDYEYFDEDIIVLNKQKNTITHGINNNHSGTINGALIRDYPEIKTIGDLERPGVVHRLDKGTSGLIIFSRSQKSYDVLKNMIKDRKISRNYTALILGKPKSSKAIIEAPIIRDPNNPLKRKVSQKGKYSKTMYTTLKNFTKYTLLEVKLFTGRTHQIRVHMLEMGNPIVGDDVYGNKNSSLDRPFLHSSSLKFIHPTKNEEMYFESNLPEDLNNFLKEI